MNAITRGHIEQDKCIEIAHGNMGFTEEGRHKGYSYHHQFIQHPRLQYVDRHFTLDDGGWRRTYMVDGVEVADLDAAIAALNVPVKLTPEEFDALRKIPKVFVPFALVWDVLAGCPQPAGAIMPRTPHQMAMRMLDALRAKGTIEYGSKPESDDEIDDGLPRQGRTTIRRTIEPSPPTKPQE